MRSLYEAHNPLRGGHVCSYVSSPKLPNGCRLNLLLEEHTKTLSQEFSIGSSRHNVAPTLHENKTQLCQFSEKGGY